ncbi:hypothetical protein KFF05_11190 [bacterium SCSIO 12827]|nr:hypothetical protein KFF05_11190 [bacterium SCSIO 12827]
MLDFITEEQLSEAPDDPALAFTQLVGHAQKRLDDHLNAADEMQSGGMYKEAQYGFMNVIIALAKAYKINPFATMDVPRHQHFQDRDYDQFKADLDHYITQLLVANSIKAKSDSVKLPPKAKDTIRSYVHGLKQAIDNSEFSDAKREKLHDKLREFEDALDKNRLSFLAVTKLTFVILAVPGSLWASYDVVSKLTHNILQVVGEAKAVEDEDRKLPDNRPMPILLPPRKEEEKPKNQGLDDEIPF